MHAAPTTRNLQPCVAETRSVYGTDRLGFFSEYVLLTATVLCLDCIYFGRGDYKGCFASQGLLANPRPDCDVSCILLCTLHYGTSDRPVGTLPSIARQVIAQLSSSMNANIALLDRLEILYGVIPNVICYWQTNRQG